MFTRRRAGAAATAPAAEAAAPGHPHRGTMILLALASITVTAFGLSAIRGIVAPVLLALVLTICAHPVRVWLERHRVPRGPATAAVIVVVLGVLAGFVYALIASFAQFATMLPRYSQQLSALGAGIAGWLRGVGFGEQQIRAVLAGFVPGNIAGFFGEVLGGAFSITGSLVVVLTMLILMAGDAGYVPAILRRMPASQAGLVRALTEYASGVRRFMVMTAVLGIAQGACNAIALAIMHVPAALLWGVLSFLCSFIPYIGYFFAIAPPLVFGAFVGGWPTVIAIIVVYGIINTIIQSIIQPRVVGGVVALSQTITFFSVLFWAAVIGPIGAILAIPLTLLGRAVLIDANPRAQFWRPAIGDIAEIKGLEHREAKAAKAAKAAAKSR